MIKINGKRLKKWIIIVIAIAILYPMPLYLFWSMMAAGSDPDMTSRIEDQYRKLPSKVLISKVKGYGDPYHPLCFTPYPFPALKVLIERREKEAVPTIIGFLKSWNNARRRDGIWALGLIGDERAIKPLMDIIKRGEKDPNYTDALMALSRMKYEKAFRYVVERAQKKDAYRNGAVAMLREFGKPNCIPILLDIKSRIRDRDPMPEFSRSLINDAIRHIETSQEKYQAK